MSTTINLKVLYPINDEKITIDNIDLNQNVKFLKSEVAKVLNCPDSELDLLFLGNVLNDETNLNELDFSKWSLVHVIVNPKVERRTFEPVSTEQLNFLAKGYSSVHSNYYRSMKSEAVKKLFEEFPEIREDLVAYTTLKDPVLLASMQHMQTLEKFNEHHPIVIHAAESILKSIWTAQFKTTSMQTDELSDSSSSSSSDTGGPSTSNETPGRAITRDQLAAALASTFSINSLANIAQRNVSETIPTPTTPNTTTTTTTTEHQGPSTSNAASGSNTTPNPPKRITPSMFANALTQALGSSTTANSQLTQQPQTSQLDRTTPTMATTPTIIPPIITSSPAEQQPNGQQYAEQLQQLRQVGFFDDDINLQALIMCNGDLNGALELLMSDAII